MTDSYNLPDSIPFTTAASDFEKLLPYGDGFERKEDLIDYAATDFLSLKNSLIKYLQAVYPLDYQNYSESDFGIMFSELVAYMGSVMSMKADMLANENYIATAQNRANVNKLLQLIGIKMKGPISSGAKASLTLDDRVGTFDEDEYVEIDVSDRVFTVTSPEDGSPLTFILYKTKDGKLTDLNAESSLKLYSTESVEYVASGTAENDVIANARVWDNLALVEGSLNIQKGVFDARESVKKVLLEKGPVCENSVQVFVNADNSNASGVYRQVDNLFQASGYEDKVFEVSYDERFNAVLLFGDGVLGVSPPANANYVINYRTGGGIRGNIYSQSISAPISARVNTLNETRTSRATNTSVSLGGADAETVAHAKRYGPMDFKRQDRLVTLEDYEAFGNRFVSTAGTSAKLTAATRKAYSSANVIDLYALEVASPTQLKRATVQFKTELLEAIDDKKMLTDDIVVADGLIRTLDLVVTIHVDEKLQKEEGTIKGLAFAKILDYFSVDKMSFGARLISQNLNKELHKIPQIRYATIDNIPDIIEVSFNEIIQLNNLTINFALI
tara:strand:- start:2746 stop:4419 length:1674 start_codon:yes stop_codon:yes gene_type:complete